MKNSLESIQELLQAIEGLKYVDEDWGQLDYYSPFYLCMFCFTPPINFPYTGF